MSNLTFQITPDSNKDSETIQMGRDLKLSCHVDATPQDKVNYTWYKNGAPVFNSDSLILLRSDPDMAPGTSSLEIVDMKFRDLATYSCVANFPGSRVPELRVDVNISQNSGEAFPFYFISLSDSDTFSWVSKCLSAVVKYLTHTVKRKKKTFDGPIWFTVFTPQAITNPNAPMGYKWMHMCNWWSVASQVDLMANILIRG